jgi:hypothetical protein
LGGHFWPKANIERDDLDGRYWPLADIKRCLLARLRRMALKVLPIKLAERKWPVVIAALKIGP